MGYWPSIIILVFTLSRICLLGKLVQQRKERWRLTPEKPHVGQELDHAHGNPVRVGRTNDRTYREISANEWAWLRHDQVGLKVLTTKRWRVQVWKGYGYAGHWVHCGQRTSIARLVRPALKVHCLSGSDTDQDSQYFPTGGSLRHRWIRAVVTLLCGRT